MAARRRRASELGCERGKQPVARGIADAEVLCIRGEALHHPGRLARGNPDGVCDHRRIESEQLGASGGRAKYPAGRGDVEPTGIMAGRDSIAEPACDLHTENEGMEAAPSRETALLRKGKQRRRNGRARMDDRLEVGVVEIEKVAADRIDEGGIEDVHALGASEKCCSGQGRQHRQ